MTSSPGPTPAARRVSSRALRPLPTPMQWRAPQSTANSRSKASSSGPSRYQPESRTLATATSSAPSISSWAARRSTKGILVFTED